MLLNLGFTCVAILKLVFNSLGLRCISFLISIHLSTEGSRNLPALPRPIHLLLCWGWHVLAEATFWLWKPSAFICSSFSPPLTCFLPPSNSQVDVHKGRPLRKAPKCEVSSKQCWVWRVQFRGETVEKPETSAAASTSLPKAAKLGEETLTAFFTPTFFISCWQLPVSVRGKKGNWQER